MKIQSTLLDTIKPQYIVDDSGKKTSVILDLKSFNSLIEELEDLYDIRQAEKIISEGTKSRGKTLEELQKSLNKKN
jgi:peptidoglycan hydrolase CwlO-like protein